MILLSCTRASMYLVSYACVRTLFLKIKKQIDAQTDLVINIDDEVSKRIITS